MLFRRNYGIEMWKYGYDGVMIYAYQHSMGSIWNDFDHKIYRDHVMAYPTVEGVIDTLAWEALREAKDDVRYINSLERQIERHEHEIFRKSKIVSEAESYLNNIGESDEYDPEQVRRTVVRFLETLTGSLGELELSEKSR